MARASAGVIEGLGGLPKVRLQLADSADTVIICYNSKIMLCVKKEYNPIRI
jgi:hypothetical protein